MFSVAVIGLGGLAVIFVDGNSGRRRLSEEERKAQIAELGKRFEFEPGRCPTDTNGRLYVRLLSGYAFTLNAREASIYASERRDPITPPANPDAPEGCLENPLHVDGFGGLRALPDADEVLDKLERIGVRPTGFLRVKTSHQDGSDYPWDFLQRMYHHLCQTYNHAKTFEYGLRACFVPKKDRPEAAWYVSYMALPSRHLTPMGKPFYALCPISIPKRGPRSGCQYGYELLPGIVLSVRTYNDGHLPARHLIAFDFLIREAVEKARFPQLDFPIEFPNEVLRNEQ